MKHQTLLVGILLTQAWMPNVAAKSLPLYRIEGSSTSTSEKITTQLPYSNDVQQSTVDRSDEYVEDFSDELYDEGHPSNERMLYPSNERMLYQSEVDKLVKERRDMFTRNLMSMSVSLSFTVIIAPTSAPEPKLIESGNEDESSYDILREKLLGENTNDDDDESSIDRANDLASNGEGKVSGFFLTDSIESESDFSEEVPGSKVEYVTLRAKLLGKGDDEEFEEDIDEEIRKANELAAKKETVGGGPMKNLRRR
jgi:hypothetical protein